MISSIEARVNAALEHEKKPTELVVHYEDITWEYALISYQAEWTYGIEFDLFDKVIVGILLVEEKMSLEEIGLILGMNVIDDPVNFRIKDNAEYDILRIAIDNLVEYDMVEVSDIEYSECYLTPLGKQYAEQGKKFKTESKKTFEVVFDRTQGSTEVDKNKYKEFKGESSQVHDTSYFEQLEVIQKAVRYQEPQLADVEKGNSINNPIIQPYKSKLYTCDFLKITLYDLETSDRRFVVIHPDSFKVIDFATEWFNCEDQSIINSNMANSNESDGQEAKLSEDLLKLQANLSSINNEIQNQISENVDFNEQDTRHRMLAQDILEVGLFSRYFGQLIDTDTTEIIIQCSSISEKDFGLWKRVFGKLKGTPTFILFGKASLDADTQEQLEKFKAQLNGSRSLIYCGTTQSKLENSISLVSEEKCIQFKLYPAVFPSTLRVYEKSVLRRSELQSKQNQELFDTIKAAISEKLFPGLLQTMEKDIQKAKADTRVNKKKNELYSLICFKGIPLSTYIKDDNLLQSWQKMLDATSELVKAKKSELRDSLNQQFKELNKEREPKDLNDVARGIEKANYLLSLLHSDFSTLEEKLTEHIQNLLRVKQTLQAKEKARTFIIDTNVFIKDPNILDRISKEDYIALSLRVIEELDVLKTRKNLKEQARQAIKNIHAELNSSKGKETRIRKVPTTLSVLPEDLRDKKVDNYILSTAVILKQSNPILVTYDKNLETKAMMLGIPTYGKKEISQAFGQKPSESSDPKQHISTGKDMKQSCKRILHRMIQKEKGPIHVSRFLGAVKSEIPNFDYKEMGYRSANQFLRSLPDVKIIDNKVTLK